MKIIERSGEYRVLPGDAGITDKLEPGVYRLLFNEDNHYTYLVDAQLQLVNGTMFGDMRGKEAKVMRTYETRPGNTGIILSGDKGLGKSMFSRIVAKECIDRGMPVILADRRAKDIQGFVAAMEQPALYLLDEYEKNFTIRHPGTNDTEDTRDQLQFLSLLDGTDGGKRLVIITCNDTYDLSKFLLDRPGRFYYHFKFKYPTGEEAVAYMRQLGLRGHEEDLGKIESLVALTGLNYDALSAITDELLQGYTLQETLDDLNIEGGGLGKRVRVTAVFDNGKVAHGETTIELDDAWSDDINLYWADDLDRRERVAIVDFKLSRMRRTSGTGYGATYTVADPQANCRVQWGIERVVDADGRRLPYPRIKEFIVTLSQSTDYTGRMLDYVD